MTPPAPASDSWVVLQRGGSHGGGNALLLAPGPGTPALLKLYRRRGSLWREAAKRVAPGVLEHRRGVTAEQRCAVERECLALWRAHGFDVPTLLDRDLPEGADARTACWMEYCPGRLLAAVVGDPAVALEEKVRLVERLAKIAGRRHALAFALPDVRFLMRDASVKHVIVYGERLVHFDFENVFHPRADLVDALSREVSTTLRSLRRRAPAHFEVLAGTFVRAYPDPARLRDAARHGALSTRTVVRLRRWRDRRLRSPGSAKVDMLRWLLDALSRGGAAG